MARRRLTADGFSPEYLADLASGARRTGDGKVIVGKNDDERAYPCEANARMLELGYPCPPGYDVPRPDMFGHIEYVKDGEETVARVAVPTVHYHGAGE